MKRKIEVFGRIKGYRLSRYKHKTLTLELVAKIVKEAYAEGYSHGQEDTRDNSLEPMRKNIGRYN